MAKIWDDHKKVLLPLFGAVAVLLILALTGFGSGFDLSWSLGGSSNNRKTYSEYPDTVLEPGYDYTARVVFNNGDAFTIDLYEEEIPKGVNSFIFLGNEEYFDGMYVHYISNGTLIQTGDPLGNGTGGPGYTFADEIKSSVNIKPYSVVYANEGEPNTNGSQFFIVCPDASSRKLAEWNGNFTAFGEVTDGKETIDELCVAQTNPDGSPKTVIKIQNLEINKISY